ncbi:hypothetical protein [Streptomyces filamentosus]|uniref:hypothetical protein n=1 Tax=Streptomyces filamentosus TaxID=67294 RepID=UPI0033EAA50B
METGVGLATAETRIVTARHQREEPREAAATKAEADRRIAEQAEDTAAAAAHAALPDDQRPDHPDMYAVSLDEIAVLLNVGKTAAGERRQAADELIRSGYRG